MLTRVSWITTAVVLRVEQKKDNWRPCSSEVLWQLIYTFYLVNRRYKTVGGVSDTWHDHITVIESIFASSLAQSCSPSRKPTSPYRRPDSLGGIHRLASKDRCAAHDSLQATTTLSDCEMVPACSRVSSACCLRRQAYTFIDEKGLSGNN